MRHAGNSRLRTLKSRTGRVATPDAGDDSLTKSGSSTVGACRAPLGLGGPGRLVRSDARR
jgi:hypothetical protein